MNRLCTCLLLALAASVSSYAEEQSLPDRTIVEVKYLKGDRLTAVTKLLSSFLHPGDVQQYGDLNAILLRGTPESVKAAQALLKRFDVPQTNASAAVTSQSCQFRIHLVEASPEEGSSGPLPQEIASAVDQMKKTFQYRTYRLLDTVIMQPGLGGGAALTGVLPVESSSGIGTMLDAEMKTVILQEGKSVFVRNFTFQIRTPVRVNNSDQAQYIVTSLRTDFRIRPGQKLVLGKLSREGSRNAIFLVITAELV